MAVAVISMGVVIIMASMRIAILVNMTMGVAMIVIPVLIAVVMIKYLSFLF